MAIHVPSTHPHANFIPDPKDRTPNDPAVLVESKYVRAYVRQNSIDVKDTEINAYINEARKCGWKEHYIQILGSSVLLKADLILVSPAAEG